MIIDESCMTSTLTIITHQHVISKPAIVDLPRGDVRAPERKVNNVIFIPNCKLRNGGNIMLPTSSRTTSFCKFFAVFSSIMSSV